MCRNIFGPTASIISFATWSNGSGISHSPFEWNDPIGRLIWLGNPQFHLGFGKDPPEDALRLIFAESAFCKPRLGAVSDPVSVSMLPLNLAPSAITTRGHLI